MSKEKVKTFRDLKVWQKAHTLTLDLYKITRDFPNDEKFGIVAQVRRSASSIATNIVEGHKRSSKKDFLHFLNLADSSLEETKYHLLLASDLGYIEKAVYSQLNGQCEEVGRMLYGFQRGIASNLTPTA